MADPLFIFSPIEKEYIGVFQNIGIKCTVPRKIYGFNREVPNSLCKKMERIIYRNNFWFGDICLFRCYFPGLLFPAGKQESQSTNNQVSKYISSHVDTILLISIF